MDASTSQPLSEQSDLRSFVAMLRRQSFTILVCGLIAAGTTFAVSFTQAKQYQASARILYTDPGSAAGGLGGGDPARAVDTFTRLATTSEILKPVAASLGFDSADAVRLDVTVTGSSSANLLDVTAVAGTPKGASALANAVAGSLIAWRRDNRTQQFRARIAFLKRQLTTLAGVTSPSQVAVASDLRTQLAEAQAQLSAPNPELTLVSPAAPPETAFSPKPIRNTILGLIAGLLLGFGIGAVRDRLDRRLRDVSEIEAVYPWPLLGVVPAIPGGAGRDALVADFASMSEHADAYRNIRTNLSLLSRRRTSTSVWAISSAVPAEGKSAATANLAGALASTGMRVLALSADLHSPSLHEYYGVVDRARPGLVEVLAGDVRAEEAAITVDAIGGKPGNPGQVDVIASGRVFSDPAILFESAAMDELLASTRDLYDAIVIDAPPLLYTAEAALLARLADGLILIAGLDLLTRHQAERTRRVLETMNLAPVGVIATGLKAMESEYGARYGYRQRPREDSSRRAQPRTAARRV